MDRFIVAEVSKSWEAHTPQTNLLCQQFEAVINRNNQRGYKLKDWKIFTTPTPEVYTETIIAIFEKKAQVSE